MIGVFKCSPGASVPRYATQGSSCFDLHACLTSVETVKAFLPVMGASPTAQLEVMSSIPVIDLQVVVPPFARVLVPTGLKFRIPEGYSIRLHPRSGLAFKNGIVLANCEGVIDQDYVDEVFAAVFNISSVPQVITHLMRVCQAELVQDCVREIVEIDVAPQQMTDRAGGFGSTGI